MYPSLLRYEAIFHFIKQFGNIAPLLAKLRANNHHLTSIPLSGEH